jgi:hypothetical protein
MDSYKWKVGADPRTFTDSVFFLSFKDNNGPLSAQLNVTNDANTDCFPDDMGIDEQSKSIFLKRIESYEEFPIYGLFEGYDEETPNERYTIEITFTGLIYDFPKDCNWIQGMPLVISHRSFVFDQKSGYGCSHPIGTGQLQPDNSLVIDYWVEDENNPDVLIEKRFIGTRIN